MGRKVEVVPYCSDWPVLFEAEANTLHEILGNQLLTIHHFGSTSIPGMKAKPIIDILAIVKDIESVDQLNPQIEALGYHVVGEYGIPGRRFFYKGTYDCRTFHLHVYESDNPNVLRHLAFRDYMRSHPESAKQYSELKESLANRFPEDMQSYIDGKNEFVKDQEKCALEWWRTMPHEKVGAEDQP